MNREFPNSMHEPDLSALADHLANPPKFSADRPRPGRGLDALRALDDTAPLPKFLQPKQLEGPRLREQQKGEGEQGVARAPRASDVAGSSAATAMARSLNVHEEIEATIARARRAADEIEKIGLELSARIDREVVAFNAHAGEFLAFGAALAQGMRAVFERMAAPADANDKGQG